jgi:hypothetical protein
MKHDMFWGLKIDPRLHTPYIFLGVIYDVLIRAFLYVDSIPLLTRESFFR